MKHASKAAVRTGSWSVIRARGRGGVDKDERRDTIPMLFRMHKWVRNRNIRSHPLSQNRRGNIAKLTIERAGKADQTVHPLSTAPPVIDTVYCGEAEGGRMTEGRSPGAAGQPGDRSAHDGSLVKSRDWETRRSL